MTSLNPVLTVGEQLMEVFMLHRGSTRAQASEQALEMLRKVHMTDPEKRLTQYPHELSGGMRQRICIARALSSKPGIIVADECVSALDVSVQAQVLDLMQELQQQEQIAYLFISHDLSVVEQISHRVAVLDQGQIVETGKTADVLHNPRHQYTQHLLNAVPVADPEKRSRKKLFINKGEKKSPIKPVGYQPEKQEYRDFGNGHMVLGTL